MWICVGGQLSRQLSSSTHHGRATRSEGDRGRDYSSPPIGATLTELSSSPPRERPSERWDTERQISERWVLPSSWSKTLGDFPSPKHHSDTQRRRRDSDREGRRQRHTTPTATPRYRETPPPDSDQERDAERQSVIDISLPRLRMFSVAPTATTSWSWAVWWAWCARWATHARWK